MKIEDCYGYILELYKRGNYGTVKRKFFVDMLDLVSFTNTKARRYIDYCINLTDKTNDIEVYSGCIHVFNRKVDIALMSGDYR